MNDDLDETPTPAPGRTRRSRPASIRKLLEILVCPLTKTTLEYDSRPSGADLALGPSRLSDPGRHSDHAARGGEKDRVARGQF